MENLGIIAAFFAFFEIRYHGKELYLWIQTRYKF